MDRLHYKFTKQEAKPVTSPLIEVQEKYQKGGTLSAEVEARKWTKDYIRANKDKFAENIKSNHWLFSWIPTKLLGNFIANYYTERVENTPTRVDNTKIASNEAAAYYPRRGVIYISDDYKDDVSTHVHEKRHIINQIGVDTLREYMKNVDGNIFAPGVKDAKFDPEEALAEAAEIKMHYPHDHVYTKEELQQIQDRGSNGYALIQPSGFLGEVYEFTPDKKVENNKPISIKDGEGVVIRKSNPSYSGLTNLNLEILDQIFNKIAYDNADKKKDDKDVMYGKDGLRMSGIPYANLIDDPKERYDYSVDDTYNSKTKHYASRDPETGLVLKGVGHPTRRLAFNEDQKLGYDWYEGYDGNTYSYDLFEAAGKPIFNTPMKEHQVVTGNKSKLTLDGLRTLIGKYKNKHNGVWSDEDIKYFYDKIQTSGFLPEAIAYVTATESSFNPKAKSSASTAAGLGQLTDSRMRQLLGSNYKEARKQYNNGTRSIKDQIDDLMLNIAQIDGSITDSLDNFGYGRLKMNYLKPSWSINRSTLEGLDLEKNLTKDQRTRITNKSSVRDLIEEYDNEFNKKFGYESK